MSAVVTGLWVYPLKSARGIALPRAEVTHHGIAHDREFMVVDAAGTFVSQRSTPALARIATAFEGDGVRLSVDGQGGPRMPFASDAARIETTVWRSKCAGDVLPEASAWIADVCGAALRVVRFVGERAVNPRYGRAQDRVMHADGYPVLVVNEGSRVALEAAAGTPVPMDRFRANVVVSGWTAWHEDDVAELAAGEVRLGFAKPCGRCSIIATDQTTGARTREPLATLTRLRRDTSAHARIRAVEGDANGLVPFGENAVVLAPGHLALGDAVTWAAR